MIGMVLVTPYFRNLANTPKVHSGRQKSLLTLFRTTFAQVKHIEPNFKTEHLHGTWRDAKEPAGTGFLEYITKHPDMHFFWRSYPAGRAGRTNAGNRVSLVQVCVHGPPSLSNTGAPCELSFGGNINASA
jgi:hypothetical protein